MTGYSLNGYRPTSELTVHDLYKDLEFVVVNTVEQGPWYLRWRLPKYEVWWRVRG